MSMQVDTGEEISQKKLKLYLKNNSVNQDVIDKQKCLLDHVITTEHLNIMPSL